MIRICSLRDYPVVPQGQALEQHTDSILSMAFFDGAERAVSLDGSLVVWDVATQTPLARRERNAPESGRMAYVAMEVLSSWGGVSPGLGLSSGASSGQQILVTTPTTLYHLDLRERGMGGGGGVLVHKASEWGLSSSYFLDTTDGGLPRGVDGVQCLASQDDGNWICTGSSNGQMCVLDKRMGEIHMNWQAHEAPIFKVLPWSRNQVRNKRRASVVRQ
jgi:WD40 repeat protein